MKEPDYLLETNVEDVRNWLSNDAGPLGEKLSDALDLAQGSLYSTSESNPAPVYILIKVSP